MTEATKPRKTPFTIPLGAVDLVFHLNEPLYGVWSDLTKLVQSVLPALKPFGFKLEGVEIKQPEKVNDRYVAFKRSTGNFYFNVGVGRLSFYAENLDWSEVEETLSCITAGLEAVRNVSPYSIASQFLTLAMHVQLKEGAISSVTSSLVSPSALKLLDGEIKCHGVILIREKATIVIDASAPYANALFVRIVREHAGNRKLQEVAETLRRDEQGLFDVLGLEGEL